jgi:TnpA family transposase
MLSKADDYPIHQTPDPIAFSGTDRNFYDRYFFNGYTTDGKVFFAAALGVYPHLNIMDAGFAVRIGDRQYNLHTSRHLHIARMEYRRKQPGIGIYTNMRDSYGLFYNQPIVLNDRQAASAVQGVEYHNATRREDQIKLSLLAVDTHGYTNVAMSVAKFLQFDLCVRLRQVSERMLYLPASIKLPDSLERLAAGKVSPKKIKTGWDQFLRFVASIREGRLTAREGLQRLGSDAKGGTMHATADEIGKLLRTIFLCDYFSKPQFRREMHALLDRGESVHQLQRAVHQGRIGTQRGRRRDELWAIS